MKKVISLLTFVSIAFGSVLGLSPGSKNLPSPAYAQALSYAFTASANSVEAGSTFYINLSLTNATAQSFYNVSVYLYQGHAIDETTVASVTPAYNATYSDPVLSGTYNPGYWVAASIAAGASSNYKVTYTVSVDAAEGRLKTLGVSPIVSGAPIEEAEANKISEMLIDVEYFTDVSAAPEFRKTIRSYVDLPTITQPLAAIASKTLPAIFTEAGSATTNIAILKRAQAASYMGFTLDTKSGNKIIWSGPLNLDNASFLSKVDKLNTYVVLTSPGVISVDTDKVPLLDASASIVFKDVNFVSAPVLLKDGEAVAESVQNTGNCSSVNRTCAFTVGGFSEYKITPSLSMTETPEVGEENYTLEAFVDDLDATVKYRLNSGYWEMVQEIDVGTGRFSADVTLTEGLNSIELVATSSNEESDTLLAEVTYTPGFVPEEPSTEPDRSSFNVVLTALAVAMIIVSLVAVAVLWMFVYRKKKQGTKVHTPNKVLTNVLSKDKVGQSGQDGQLNRPEIARDFLGGREHARGKGVEGKEEDKEVTDNKDVGKAAEADKSLEKPVSVELDDEPKNNL